MMIGHGRGARAELALAKAGWLCLAARGSSDFNLLPYRGGGQCHARTQPVESVQVRLKELFWNASE